MHSLSKHIVENPSWSYIFLISVISRTSTTVNEKLNYAMNKLNAHLTESSIFQNYFN